MRRNGWMRREAAIVLSVALIHCGGIDSGPAVLVVTERVAPGAMCETGGAKVVTGADDDGDGVLAPNEVDSTEVICNGANGVEARVSRAPEPAGDNCPLGGIRVAVGLDDNANGGLDPTEIDTTTYVCTTKNTVRLDGLELSVGRLEESFNPSVSTYTASASFLAISVRVRAFTGDPTATLTVNGEPAQAGEWSNPFTLSEGVNTVAVVVTNRDAQRVYSVDVYRDSAQSMVQTAYVKASHPNVGHRLGFSVALDGDTLAVGAPWEAGNGEAEGDDSVPAAGAVYVFRRRDGLWTQEAYLKAANLGADDEFGRSIALDGDTLAVGAPGEASGDAQAQADDSAPAAGAVYIFRRRDGQWRQEAYVKASNPAAGDWFSRSIALDGDTLVVGAPLEDSASTGVNGEGQDDNSAEAAGAAYVFERLNGQWRQVAYLKASETDLFDLFGQSVAVDGDTLAVGAPGEDSNSTGINGPRSDNSSENSGAVLVFRRRDAQWRQAAYLKASNTDVRDLFGTSVALDGDTLAVGAPGEDGRSATSPTSNSLAGAGAVYLFTRFGERWRQSEYLKALISDFDDEFGISVALDGDVLAVGARSEDGAIAGVPVDNSALNAGAAYVFTRDDEGWAEPVMVKASNPDAGDRFGWSVALGGGALAAGAVGESSGEAGVNSPGQEDNAVGLAGAVYVFR